jgi:hypothetical protein
VRVPDVRGGRLGGRGCDWSSDPALALDGDLRATLRSGFFTVAQR